MNVSYSFQTGRVRICWKHHISILPVYRVAKSFDSLPPGGNCWNSRRHLWEKFLQTQCLELSPLVLTESWLRRVSWVLWVYFIIFMLQSGSNHYTDMAQRVWSRLLWAWAWKEATFQCVISFTINMISFSVCLPPLHTHHLIACPKFYLQRHLVVPCYMRNLWKMISKFFQSL